MVLKRVIVDGSSNPKYNGIPQQAISDAVIVDGSSNPKYNYIRVIRYLPML